MYASFRFDCYKIVIVLNVGEDLFYHNHFEFVLCKSMVERSQVEYQMHTLILFWDHRVSAVQTSFALIAGHNLYCLFGQEIHDFRTQQGGSLLRDL